ncbi:MAG: DUF4393 domain-containing protein [Paludibacteraceae bacterium]|nr:DUF4393 domain-containing protein [Paludibacteraceae bacterium]
MIDETGKELAKQVTNDLVKDVYDDLVHPAAKVLGSTLGQAVNLALAPLKGFIWGFDQIEILVKSTLENKLKKVGDEKIKTPDPIIAVPIIQSLQYTANNVMLREMYMNLLANSMNVDMEKSVHPIYVNIIKQMNSLDAQIINKLNTNMPTICPRFVKGKKQLLTTPTWITDLTIDGYDDYDISASLERLKVLGLITLTNLEWLIEDDKYYVFDTLPIIQKMIENYTPEYEYTYVKGYYCLNEIGRSFKNVCLY